MTRPRAELGGRGVPPSNLCYSKASENEIQCSYIYLNGIETKGVCCDRYSRRNCDCRVESSQQTVLYHDEKICYDTVLMTKLEISKPGRKQRAGLVERNRQMRTVSSSRQSNGNWLSEHVGGFYVYFLRVFYCNIITWVESNV